MQLDQLGMVLLEDLCHKHPVGEVSAEVAFGSAEGDAVDPLEELLHLVLVDRRGFH